MTRITTFRPFVVNHSAARMPSSVHARYRHGAILKTDGATDHGFVANYHGSKTIRYSGKLHAGGKNRDAFHDWLNQAEADCGRMNDEYEIALMRELGCAPWQVERAQEQQNS